MSHNGFNVGVWVIAHELSDSCLELLGDARRAADSMQTAVGVLLIHSGHRPGISEAAETAEQQGAKLIEHGADVVRVAVPDDVSEDNEEREKPDQPFVLATRSLVDTAIRIFEPHDVKLVYAGGDPASREWAALLAVKQGWSLVSPALMVDFRQGRRLVTRLDHTGRKSCQEEVGEGDTVVVTMRQGVAEACASDRRRSGDVRQVTVVHAAGRVASQVIPVNPATSDIRYASRLIAGGRGLGSRQGFELLREVAALLDAGVAASRMAVDLGWIEYERQVGQTGKTVDPELYIACGISGASHHLEGMSGAQHVVAINTDASAPIMQKAHLGLVADLHLVLQQLIQLLKQQKSKLD